MKKTLLGCAVVLLSIGLLSGCNKEDTINPSDIEPDPDPDIVEPGPEDADPVATSISVTGDDDLVILCNANDDTSGFETLNLRDTITVTVLDQFGDEYTGKYGSEYTLTTTSNCISLDYNGIATGISEGIAEVTITSKANKEVTTAIEINVICKEYEVESISVSLSGNTNSEGYTVLDWGATSSTLEVTFTPTYASVQTYEVTSDLTSSEVGTYFTYNETTHTFTHTRLNTGTETFVITATDQSYEASATITLECDPVIDEPYEVEWVDLPTEVAKGTTLDLNSYVQVDYDHEGQDNNEYEDDTYTLSFVGSDGVTIDGTKATFTGSGGSTQYITVTATPNHALNSSVYAQSSNIVITQAITGVTFNHDPLVFLYDDCYSLYDGTKELEVITLEPEDYYPKGGEISWSISSGEGVISIAPDTEDNTKCSVTPLSNGEATIIVSLGNSEIGSCDVAVQGVEDCSFATDPWDIINEICANGLASTCYQVGNTKKINIGIEDEEYQEHEIRIIDFDHDTLTTNDSSYNKNSGKAAITCEMVDSLSTSQIMDSSGYNTNGWDGCEMRRWLNSDSGCVLSTLDEDLQSVIKKVNKATLSSGSQTSSFTTSSDRLFLLAEVEVDNTTDAGFVGEGTRYEYYNNHSNQSDRIKYQNGSAAYWWLRSPFTLAKIPYMYVSENGSTGTSCAYNPAYEQPVSFAFCV